MFHNYSITNKEYIMSNVKETYKNPESFAGEVDEIISKVSSRYDDIIKKHQSS